MKSGDWPSYVKPHVRQVYNAGLPGSRRVQMTSGCLAVAAATGGLYHELAWAQDS